jgi:hypothetical protein
MARWRLRLTARAFTDLERRPPTMFVVIKRALFPGRIRDPILE